MLEFFFNILKMKFNAVIFLLTFSILINACAIKHHVQLSDIQRVKGKKLTPFKVMVNETGVDVEQAGNLISGITRDNEVAKNIASILAMFQMGPRTGYPVFNEQYADSIPLLVLKECPSGRVTGLLMIRETNKYPVISGEIVKITGYCIN